MTEIEIMQLIKDMMPNEDKMLDEYDVITLIGEMYPGFKRDIKYERNSQLDKLRQEINEKIDKLREEMNERLAKLENKLRDTVS